MDNNQEYQFGQGWEKYLKSEYSLDPTETKDSLPSRDVREDQPEKYKFGSGNENLLKYYNDNVNYSSLDVPEQSAIEMQAEKMLPSAIIGGWAAMPAAAGSAAYNSGKYALQSPLLREAIKTVGPAYNVLRGRVPEDLMKKASDVLSQQAFERGILGGTDDLSGTTGRARQTMYNTETARQAAVRGGLDNPFTRSTWGATNTGILVPPSRTANVPSPKPSGGLSSMITPEMRQTASGIKNFVSSVVPKAAARGLGGLGVGLSGAETLRTGAEALKDPASVPEFVLNALGTGAGIASFVPAFTPIAAPIAFGAPALAATIGAGREGRKIEQLKNIEAKKRFESLPKVTVEEIERAKRSGPAFYLKEKEWL